jgi:hypothetical protein
MPFVSRLRNTPVAVAPHPPVSEPTVGRESASWPVLLQNAEPTRREKRVAGRISRALCFTNADPDEIVYARALTKPLKGSSGITVPTAQAAVLLKELFGHATTATHKAALQKAVKKGMHDELFIQYYAEVAGNGPEIRLSAAQLLAHSPGFATVLDQIFAPNIEAGLALGREEKNTAGNKVTGASVGVLVSLRVKEAINNARREQKINQHPFQSVFNARKKVNDDNFLLLPIKDHDSKPREKEVTALLDRLFDLAATESDKRDLIAALVDNTKYSALPGQGDSLREILMTNLAAISCVYSGTTHTQRFAANAIANEKKMASVLDRILAWPIAARVTELNSGLTGCKRPTMIFEPIDLLVEARALQQIK